MTLGSVTDATAAQLAGNVQADAPANQIAVLRNANQLQASAGEQLAESIAQIGRLSVYA
jgi:hypothetical protein